MTEAPDVNVAPRLRPRLKLRRSVSTGLLLAAWAVAAVAPIDASAAGTVVLSASPTQAKVGERVEVLLRTFLPFSVSDLGLGVPVPSMGGYPVASGFWSVLYPWPEYPFRVVATGPTGESIVAMSPDPNDVTLYRGVFAPDVAGKWTIRVTNFEPGVPGAETMVVVDGAKPPLTTSPPSDSQGQPVVPPTVWLAPLALVVGTLFGLIVGIASRDRFPRTKR